MESFATPSAFKTQDDLLKRFVYYNLDDNCIMFSSNLHPPYLTVSYQIPWSHYQYIIRPIAKFSFHKWFKNTAAFARMNLPHQHCHLIWTSS